jgi:hypothetical protein
MFLRYRKYVHKHSEKCIINIINNILENNTEIQLNIRNEIIYIENIEGT